MSNKSPSPSEMKVVYEARAQSRDEAADLENLKRRLRQAYLDREDVSDYEFDRSWPTICSEALQPGGLSLSKE